MVRVLLLLLHSNAQADGTHMPLKRLELHIDKEALTDKMEVVLLLAREAL
jgi:hypothetical protein